MWSVLCQVWHFALSTFQLILKVLPLRSWLQSEKLVWFILWSLPFKCAMKLAISLRACRTFTKAVCLIRSLNKFAKSKLFQQNSTIQFQTEMTDFWTKPTTQANGFGHCTWNILRFHSSVSWLRLSFPCSIAVWFKKISMRISFIDQENMSKRLKFNFKGKKFKKFDGVHFRLPRNQSTWATSAKWLSPLQLAMDIYFWMACHWCSLFHCAFIIELFMKFSSTRSTSRKIAMRSCCAI